MLRLMEQVHLHDRRRAVGRRRHVGVVDVAAVGKPAVQVGAVVRLRLHGVVPEALAGGFCCWKFPAAAVKPIGDAAR